MSSDWRDDTPESFESQTKSVTPNDSYEFATLDRLLQRVITLVDRLSPAGASIGDVLPYELVTRIETESKRIGIVESPVRYREFQRTPEHRARIIEFRSLEGAGRGIWELEFTNGEMMKANYVVTPEGLSKQRQWLVDWCDELRSGGLLIDRLPKPQQWEPQYSPPQPSEHPNKAYAKTVSDGASEKDASNAGAPAGTTHEARRETPGSAEANSDATNALPRPGDGLPAPPKDAGKQPEGETGGETKLTTKIRHTPKGAAENKIKSLLLSSSFALFA